MMNRLRLIDGRTASAPVERERLQILLAHERGLRDRPDLLGVLRAEILAVVSRHIVLDPGKVDSSEHVSALEIDIEVPNRVQRTVAVAATARPAGSNVPCQGSVKKERNAAKALKNAFGTCAASKQRNLACGYCSVISRLSPRSLGEQSDVR